MMKATGSAIDKIQYQNGVPPNHTDIREDILTSFDGRCQPIIMCFSLSARRKGV